LSQDFWVFFDFVSISEQDLVELILVVLNVLGEAFVQLDVVLSVLPACTVGSSSKVVNCVLLMGLEQLPVSLETGLFGSRLLVFALISCVFESSFN